MMMKMIMILRTIMVMIMVWIVMLMIEAMIIMMKIIESGFIWRYMSYRTGSSCS